MSVVGRGATTENDIIKGVMTAMTTLDDIILCITTTRYYSVFNSNVFSLYYYINRIFENKNHSNTIFESTCVCVYKMCSYIIWPQHDVLLFMKNDTSLYENNSRWEWRRQRRWFFNRLPITRQLEFFTDFIILYVGIRYCIDGKIFPQKIKAF